MTSVHEKQHKHNAKPTKHATIMRGVVAPVFGLLAVLFIVLGALNMTVWKPASEVSATTSISGSRYIVTDSGMLNLLAKSVKVKVSTQGNSTKTSSESDNNEGEKSSEQTCVALGNAKDATGWLAGQDYNRVTGLDGWKALSTKTATGPKITATQGGDEVAFKDSDMWTSVKCGDSAITLNLNDVKNDQVMIIDTGASTKKAKPSVSITMHWVRDQVPNHAMPFFVAAGVCVILTTLSASIFAIMANESFKRKRQKRRSVREKEKAEEVSISEAMTGSIAVLKTSLTHSSHNHRPSHKIQPSDLAATGVSDSSEAGTGGSSNEGSSLSAGSEGDLSDADVSAPSIIDPTRRNLVADMQMQNDSDEDAVDGPDASQNDSVSNDASDSEFQAVGDTDADHGVEEETAESQGSETENSSEPAVAMNSAAKFGPESTGDADIDTSRFARHRGKPEQESESDTESLSIPVGRHSRHVAAGQGSDGILSDYDTADNHDNSDNHDNADNQADGNSANDREQPDDFRTANVAVSLEHPEDKAASGDDEHASTQSGETRTASSADELIDKNHAQAETAVLSEDELREYFARLYSEESEDDTNDETESAQAAPEAGSKTSDAHVDGETT